MAATKNLDSVQATSTNATSSEQKGHNQGPDRGSFPLADGMEPITPRSPTQRRVTQGSEGRSARDRQMSVLRSFRKLTLAALLFALPCASYSQVSIGVSINIAPPVLPIYVQPVCPAPNYIWTPGYWAWGEFGYYWVPGTWVLAPQPGYLWTPGYWGWGAGGVYVFNPGYWGLHVGFYGGVNYGFGYGGVGFVGGEWRGGSFAYNTAVVNVNTTVIHNTYINKTVINNTTIINNNRTSFNGGPNGIAARPTAQEQAYSNERHIPPTQAQVQHVNLAKQDRANYATVNHGMPAHAALPKPAASTADFARAVPARGATAAPFTPAKAGTIPKPAAEAKPAESTAATRPAPAARPAPATKPAPEAKPATKPAPEAKPATRPAPEAKPAPAAKPAPRPAPEAKPAPAAKPAPRPAPEAKPAPAAKPAPEAHPQAKPAPKPAPKPEEKRPE